MFHILYKVNQFIILNNSKEKKNQMNNRISMKSIRNPMRSKSEAVTQKISHQCLNQLDKDQIKQKGEGERRCQCCNPNKLKYHDYLSQLRRQRLEKMKRKIISQQQTQIEKHLFAVPMIESKKMDEEIILSQFSLGDQKNVISKMSNKVSEYEQTPKKSLLHQFHESILKSGSRKNKIKNSLNRCQIHPTYETRRSNEEQFHFEIQICNPETNETYYRKFTAAEYGSMAISCIEEILSQNQ